MLDEAAFLQAILAAPGDDAARLVYADWLEERGDPRGEYIRLRLKLREPRGRKRVQARLAKVAPHIDNPWRQQVFAVPSLAIKKFRRVKRPITEPVTKFGGQPVWIAEPTWPIGSGGEPMQFICQVRLPDFCGAPLSGKMVYVFALHPDFANWEEFCGTISPLYPDEGDNAVVLQPAGEPPAPIKVLPVGSKGQRRRKRRIRTEAWATGPTLYDGKGTPGEWLVDLKPSCDPDYTPNTNDHFHDEAAWDRYYKQVHYVKIGGTPPWGNGLHAEIDSLATDREWRLVLSYDFSVPYFTVWEAGFEWSVWVTRDGKRGFLMGGR